MDRLDACYFCGTAGEAQLREVSIAPRARQGDPDATVATTLCPSCEGKLQTLLGRVFDNVESRRVEGAGGATEESAGAGGDEAAAGADGGAVEAGADGGRAAADDPGHPVDRIDVSGERSDATRGGGDRRPLFDPAPDVDDGPEPDDEPIATGEMAAADGEDSTEADDAPSGAADDDASGSAAADPPGGDAEILADDDEPTVRARASSSAADPLDGVSVAEYNRVMRLLQNREFPMPREAFVDLASSAYDLETGAVQQVLDAVVDQGALAERDGDLVRPGGRGGPGGPGGPGGEPT